MRSPNHLEIKKACRQAIAPLMAKHHLGVVKEVKVDENGWVNPCFFVDGKFVFRFNARDPGLPKFQREKLIFDLLKDSAVPVPRRVLLDDSRDCIRYDVLISEILPGQNLERAWPQVNLADRMALCEDAGRILTQLHHFSFPFFGEIVAAKSPFPRTETWRGFLEAKLSLHLNETVALGIFTSPQAERFSTALRARHSSLAEVQTAHLVHVDYFLGNLLFAGHKITGVLDFEWALAGDPLYDDCHWRSMSADFPESLAPFLRGRKPYSPSEIERMRLYQMIRNVELCPVAHLYFSPEEALAYKVATLQHLDHLEL